MPTTDALLRGLIEDPEEPRPEGKHRTPRPLTDKQRELLAWLEEQPGPVTQAAALSAAGYGANAPRGHVLTGLTFREPRLYECDDGRIGLLDE